MRRVAGVVVVVVALVFVVLALAGSAGEPDAGRVASGATLLAAPVAALGGWLLLGPGRQGWGASRPRWHAPTAVVVVTFALAAAPPLWGDGYVGLAIALIAIPVGALLWWWITERTDAPPRPTLATLPDGTTEAALRYAIPGRKQAVPRVAAGTGAVALTAVALSVPGGAPGGWLAALGAVACVGVLARTGGRTDPDAGVVLSRSGVGLRRDHRSALVPWEVLRRVDVGAQRDRRPLVGRRSRLYLYVDGLEQVQGVTPALRRRASLDPETGTIRLVWPGWMLDTPVERIADHVDVLRHEPDARPGVDVSVDLTAAGSEW